MMFLDLKNEPSVLHKLAEVWFTLLCITRSYCRNQLCNLTPLCDLSGLQQTVTQLVLRTGNHT